MNETLSETPQRQTAAPRVGRLAPSPTGAQHVGNARTYFLAWLAARSGGGRIVLRIEDIDSPRIKPWAAQQAIDDLRWLGLDWDEGPDRPGEVGPYVQTARREMYEAALRVLAQEERIYPCTCTRSDVAAAASAPHVGQEGPKYPGTCAHRRAADAKQIGGPFCWRYRASNKVHRFVDALAGEQQMSVADALGDFVVCKADGTPAYQLAVVIDDHAMGITEVVRGDDLLASTFRQLELYEFFEWQPPNFAHVPLVIGPDGRRLAKRHGDTRISLLRERGISSQQFIGFLAWSCGLQRDETEASAAEFVAKFDWSLVPREPFVLTDNHWQKLLHF